MESRDYLSYLSNHIPAVTAAVTDKNGLPLTCALNIMSCSENGIYLLVPRHTEFYQALTQKNYLSFTGIALEDGVPSVSLSLRGSVSEKSPAVLSRLSPFSRTIPRGFSVFLLSQASGEWASLKAERETASFSFSFSSGEYDRRRFFITDRCVLCRLCAARCPQKCISISQRPAKILQEDCIRCGTCYETCLAKAIICQEEAG